MDVRIIGIAGGTASGKTTVTRAAVDALGERATLLVHDRYYANPPPGLDPARWNYDHPDALETDLLVQHLRALRAGDAVDVPRYDFHRHLRAQGSDRVDPRPVVFVEGVLVLADARLRAELDVAVFVHAPADLRLVRRIHRDMAERGRHAVDVLRQYVETVRPMHERFVEPSRHHADLVLDGTSPIDASVQAVMGLLEAASTSRAP